VLEDALRIIAEAEAGKKGRKRSSRDKEKKRDKGKKGEKEKKGEREKEGREKKGVGRQAEAQGEASGNEARSTRMKTKSGTGNEHASLFFVRNNNSTVVYFTGKTQKVSDFRCFSQYCTEKSSFLMSAVT